VPPCPRSPNGDKTTRADDPGTGALGSFIGNPACGLDDSVRGETFLVVRVHLRETDDAFAIDDENAGVGEYVVGFAGRGLDVDLILGFILGNQFVGNLEGDALLAACGW
jgi:hypothetical protein